MCAPGEAQRPTRQQRRSDMQMSVIYAFVVVAVAPLVGIWRGHVWAKKNGLSLRKPAPATDQQTA